MLFRSNLKRILQINNSRLTVFLLEQIRLLSNRIIQNINDIILLLVAIQIDIQHITSSCCISWVNETSIGILRIVPIELLNLLHVLEVSCKGHGHTLNNHSLHDCLTVVYLFRLGSVDNHRARVLKHDSVEGGFVALVMDMDVV